MNKYVSLSFIVLIVIAALAGGYYLGMRQSRPEQNPTVSQRDSAPTSPDSATEEQSASSESATVTTATPKARSSINMKALPLGDNKVTTTPKVGYIYSCQKQSDENGGGAGVDGPWINKTTNTWDYTQKVTVSGEVIWKNAKWSVTENGATRTLTGNGLPSHKTGTYPIQSSDDAYKYDRNPNSIKEQTLSLNLPTTPTQLASAECVGGEVGIMLTGIPIFNGFDADSRDAAAHEIQDDCAGHPQVSGQYHYHSPSKCLKDTPAATEHSALVGYAFDGFGIYGIKGQNGVELSTQDLDVCHGHTHEIVWDGQKKTMYHYHLTNDFPYSVSCFRGKKAVNGPLSGKTEGMQQGGQQSGQSQMSGQGPGGQRMPPPPGGAPPQN